MLLAALLTSSMCLTSATPPSESPLGLQDPNPPATAAPRDRATPNFEDLEPALRIVGLDFDDDQRRMMLRDVRRNLRHFEQLRRRSLPNGLAPAVAFAPMPAVPDEELTGEAITIASCERPIDDEDLAFASIAELAGMVRSRSITCLELCDFFLARLERLDSKLACVITLMPDRSRARALELDRMLDDGIWLGPLHGIPYGAKDLLAAAGAPTTYGATPFRDQVLGQDAAVVQTLESKGALLIAKLSLGALAMGDVWFGGRTNNPWDLEQGSSGSSAGSAAAVVAGGIPFALGSETLGSILSPSARCGASGLRPTFGAVDTTGAMALSWSMDKLGPICRRAEDAALVFEAIQSDSARIQRPFTATEGSVEGMRVGVLSGSFADDDPFLAELAELGCELVAFDPPVYPVGSMLFVLVVEAAASFDELTRSGRDATLVRQDPDAWPNLLRTARLIPAVEYVQAMRLRHQLMLDYEQAFDDADVAVYVHRVGATLAATNLCGQPSLAAPRGFLEDGTRGSVGFTARNYREDVLLRLVQAWQSATDHDEARPKIE